MAISESIGGLATTHFAPEHGEILAIGQEAIALLDLSGQLITSRKLSSDTTIIGQQRTPTGWQYLIQKDTRFINCTLRTDNITDIEFETSHELPHTAAWSPSGQYVAVGSTGTTLSVWDTNSGKQLLQKSIQWDNDHEFINPPNLSVIGWCKIGKNIITSAEEMLFSSVVIWDFANKEIVTIIE